MNQRQLSLELECPICCLVPRNPPIYQCENGHLLCSACKPKMKNVCPQGKCEIQGLRCRLAESILEKADLPRPCIFSMNGCLFEENVESLIIHEEICNYRIVSCPDPECDIKPIEKDVIPHLIEDHLVLQSEIEKCCQEDNCLWIIEDSDLMDLPCDKTWPLSPFKYKDKTFFSVLMKSSVDNNWYAWIYALGSKVSDEYISQITLKNGNDIHETLTYRGKIHGLDESGKEIINDSKAMIMTTSQIKKMLSEMTSDQKGPGEENKFKFLLSISYKVEELSIS